MYFTLALDIKGANIVSFKNKLNIKNALLIFLIFNFLVVNNANSAPPPLPPALPKQEDNKINNNEESKKESSFLDRIFGSEKSDANVVTKPVQQTLPVTDDSNNTENVDDFINLGDKKLPILEKSRVEDENNPTLQKGQKNDSTDIVIPSLPPEVQDDGNLYIKPIESNSLSIDPLKNDNDTKNIIPALPPVLPPSKVDLPKMDDQAVKKEAIPLTDTEPVPVPVLPPALPPSELEVPKIDDQVIKEEPMAVPDTTPVPVPVLPPVFPPSKLEVPKVGGKNTKEEIISSPKASSEKSAPVPIPVLPPVSVPEVEVTKPLLDKKDNNTKTLPSLPTEKVAVPSTLSDEMKTDVDKSSSSTEKLLLDNNKIPVKPKGQSPIPVFVGGDKPVIEKKKNEKKIIEEDGKSKPKQLEKTIVITTPAPVVGKDIPEKEMSEELTQFINNETQMLLLPNDDIVLGNLTDEAKIEQQDMSSFINEFKQVYDRDKRKNQRQKIDNFIKNYSSNFRTLYIMPCNVMNMAFDTIRKNDLSSLRGLLDNYPILQRKGEGNNTLLHIAAEQNNYYIAKFLLIRGIHVNPLNDECKTALDIVRRECNGNIACLIKKRKNIIK